MNDKNEDRSLFVFLLHLFLDIKYQISNITKYSNERRQYLQDCNHTATYVHITDNILQTRAWIRLRCFICVLCTAWYIVGSEDRRNTSRNSSLTQSTRTRTWEKCDLFQWLQFEPTVKQNKDCHFC